MSGPRFSVLTQSPVVIDLSRPAMEFILWRLRFDVGEQAQPGTVGTEVDNFINLLQNLLDRSETETENMDLVGG